jgi:hypothetical protein
LQSNFTIVRAAVRVNRHAAPHKNNGAVQKVFGVAKYFFPTWDSLWYFRECPKIYSGITLCFRLWTAGWPGPTPIDKAYWRSDLSGKPKPGQYEPETGGHLADVGLIDKARAEPG